jgi:hypothetical protein
MSVPLDVVTSISRDVIAQVRGDLELLGVVSTDGGSDRIELLVTVAGCHSEPCRLALNVTRADAAAFEDELRTKLRHALISHDMAK